MCKVAPSWRVARARVRSSTHRGVSSCSQPLMAQRAGEVPRPRSNAYLDRLVLDSIEGTWWLIGGVRSAAAGAAGPEPHGRCHRSCPCRDPRSWFLLSGVSTHRRANRCGSGAIVPRGYIGRIVPIEAKLCRSQGRNPKRIACTDDTSLSHTAHHVRRTRRARRQPQRRTA